GPGAPPQGWRSRPDSPNLEVGEQVWGEMQARGGRGDGPRTPGVDRLVPLLVRAIGIARDVRRKRHPTDRPEELSQARARSSREAHAVLATSQRLDHLRRGATVELDLRLRLEALARLTQADPVDLLRRPFQRG